MRRLAAISRTWLVWTGSSGRLRTPAYSNERAPSWYHTKPSAHRPVKVPATRLPEKDGQHHHDGTRPDSQVRQVEDGRPERKPDEIDHGRESHPIEQVAQPATQDQAERDQPTGAATHPGHRTGGGRRGSI